MTDYLDKGESKLEAAKVVGSSIFLAPETREKERRSARRDSPCGHCWIKERFGSCDFHHACPN